MALAAVRNTLRQDNVAHPGNHNFPVEAATTIWQGGMVCVNAAGNAVPAAATAGFSAVFGRAESTQVNAGAAGDLNVEVVPGVYRYDNSGTSIADANRGEQCYAVDDEAVHLSNAGGRPLAGTIIDVDALGVWVSTSGLMTSAGASESTTDTSSIFHVRGASTANVAALATFTVANDGIVLVEDDLVFLKDQAAGQENGVYICGAVAGGLCILTRALHADDGSELHANTIVVVEAGTDNLDTAWKMTNDGAIVIDTTVQVWAQTPFAFGLVGAMTAETIGQAAGAGVANTAAPIDHVHAMPASAAPLQVDCALTAPAAGAAGTFADSAHVHGVAVPVAAAQIDCVVTAAAAGASIVFATADHVHGVVAPIAPADTGELAAVGASAIFATANHVHAEHSHEVRYVMTTDVAALGAFVVTQDGVVGVEGDLVLLANQTVPAEAGVYVLGAVVGTAPLTRVPWLPADAIVTGGYTVHVNEGTLFASTSWFIDTAGETTIGTTAHTWYPETVTFEIDIPPGTGTVTWADIPILSATRTQFIFTNRAEVTADLTVRYGLNGAATAGVVGVCTASMIAEVAAGTVNVDDDSSMLISVLNR